MIECHSVHGSNEADLGFACSECLKRCHQRYPETLSATADSLAKNDIHDRISIDEIEQKVCSIRLGVAAAGALY